MTTKPVPVDTTRTKVNLTGFPRFDWVRYGFEFSPISKNGYETGNRNIGTHLKLILILKPIMNVENQFITHYI